MRVFVEKKGHKISIERDLKGMRLLIDEQEVDSLKDYITANIKDSNLIGKVKNEDGTEDEVKATVKVGFSADKVDIFYNGKIIYSGEAR